MEKQFTDPLRGKKVSDVFQDYAEPFLKTLLLDRAKHGIHDIPSIAELERVYRIPWCIWNAIIAEIDINAKNKIDYLAWINNSIKHMPDSIKNLLAMLEERKRNEFKQYKYYFGKYNFYYNQQKDLRLRVEARMPETSG